MECGNRDTEGLAFEIPAAPDIADRLGEAYAKGIKSAIGEDEFELVRGHVASLFEPLRYHRIVKYQIVDQGTEGVGGRLETQWADSTGNVFGGSEESGVSVASIPDRWAHCFGRATPDPWQD